MAQSRHFDFVIINGLFETALFDLKTVVHSQRLRCLLYTSDAADERSSVDLGGRRIIKKKTRTHAMVVLISLTNYDTYEYQCNHKTIGISQRDE